MYITHKMLIQFVMYNNIRKYFPLLHIPIFLIIFIETY